MLSESDARVLKAISEGFSNPQAIADKLGMKIEAVRASADALGEQDLVKVFKAGLWDDSRPFIVLSPQRRAFLRGRYWRPSALENPCMS